MIHVVGPALQVRRGRDPGKRLEVVNKMRLIVIAALERHLNPVDFANSVRCPDHLLEATDAAEQLGRQPYFVAEELDESPLAEAHLLYHSRNRRRLHSSKELLQGERDYRMVLQRLR